LPACDRKPVLGFISGCYNLHASGMRVNTTAQMKV